MILITSKQITLKSILFILSFTVYVFSAFLSSTLPKEFYDVWSKFLLKQMLFKLNGI